MDNFLEWVFGAFPGALILFPIFGAVIVLFALLYAVSWAIVPAPDPGLVNVVFMTGVLFSLAGGALWLWLSHRSPLYPAGVLGGMGSLCLYATIIGWHEIVRLRSAGTTVAGQVTGVGWDTSRALFNRTVSYTYSFQGHQCDGVSNYRRRRLQPVIGDTVQVVLDPSKPERAMLAVNLRR